LPQATFAEVSPLSVHAINEGRHAAREVDMYLMGYRGLS
jgi:hypothetical protein